MKVKFLCELCNQEFFRTQYYIGKAKFCSKICASKSYEVRFKGENNPNFNMRWSDSKKKIMSERVIEEYKTNPNKRINAGKANKGKKFSQERIDKMHGHRAFESYSRPMSDTTKKKVGLKSKAKWTEAYTKKHMNTMQKLGHYYNPEDKDNYIFYRDISNWKEKMFNLNIEGKLLLKNLKVFNKKDNTKGAVRDHKLSRKSGFLYRIFPEILRHPCNCEVISQPDNVKKRFREKDSITTDELFERIENYNFGDYNEHDLCLQLIKDYREGKRYIKEDYVKKIYE